MKLIIATPQGLTGTFPVMKVDDDLHPMCGLRGLLHGSLDHYDLILWYQDAAKLALVARENQVPVVMLDIGEPTILPSTTVLVELLKRHAKVQRVVVLCAEKSATDRPEHRNIKLYELDGDNLRLIDSAQPTSSREYWTFVADVGRSIVRTLELQEA